MDHYVVAGNPVEHSQSPFIHAAFAQQTGQAMDYGRLLVPLGGFADVVRALADGGTKGCNITVPFKFDAFALAARHTGRAALAQAANVLRFDADGWLADNTDGAGLVADIERNAGVALAGARVLLIGAGGAASGALGPLLAAEPGELVVANRTLDKGRALVERHREAASATLLRAATLEGCGRD
ncbi:MAG: shikimate dehydrogenase, partial [Pseudomonadota bacterium]